MEKGEIAILLKQAERCRWLAADSIDGQIRATLLATAVEYEAEACALERDENPK